MPQVDMQKWEPWVGQWTCHGRTRTAYKRQLQCHSINDTDGGCYNPAVFLHSILIHLHCRQTKLCFGTPTCSASNHYEPAPTLIEPSINALYTLRRLSTHPINNSQPISTTTSTSCVSIASFCSPANITYFSIQCLVIWLDSIH